MKRIPILVVIIGAFFSYLIASANPITKVENTVTYSYFNYQLLTILISLTLLIGIIMLWMLKNKDR